MVEDPVDAIGVGAVGVAVDFHEEKNGPFVLVVRSGVPGPGCELRVRFECGGAFAYCEAGLDEPRGLSVSIKKSLMLLLLWEEKCTYVSLISGCSSVFTSNCECLCNSIASNLAVQSRPTSLAQRWMGMASSRC